MCMNGSLWADMMYFFHHDSVSWVLVDNLKYLALTLMLLHLFVCLSTCVASTSYCMLVQMSAEKREMNYSSLLTIENLSVNDKREAKFSRNIEPFASMLPMDPFSYYYLSCCVKDLVAHKIKLTVGVEGYRRSFMTVAMNYEYDMGWSSVKRRMHFNKVSGKSKQCLSCKSKNEQKSHSVRKGLPFNRALLRISTIMG